MPIKSYKDLIVWQKSLKLALAIYKLTATFPKNELFGLTSQLRRAAVSVASNIAEGYQRKSKGEFLRFLLIALGSASELETQIMIAKELKLADSDKFLTAEGLLLETLKLLNFFIKSNKKSNS